MQRNIISHATMGETTGEGMTMNDICVLITARRNELYQQAKAQAEADKAAAVEPMRVVSAGSNDDVPQGWSLAIGGVAYVQHRVGDTIDGWVSAETGLRAYTEAITTPAPMTVQQAARVLLDDLAQALATDMSDAGKAAGRRWLKAHDAAEAAPTAMNKPTPIQMIRAALSALTEAKP